METGSMEKRNRHLNRRKAEREGLAAFARLLFWRLFLRKYVNRLTEKMTDVALKGEVSK